MSERQILFKGPMVRAILEGRKTQTRRPVKPQPYLGAAYAIALVGGLWRMSDRPDGCGCGSAPFRCPCGKSGDTLWVRETFRLRCGRDEFVPEEGEYIWYEADTATGHEQESVGRLRPSTHMPKLACRLRLRVTDVRVERVQEITAHAIAHYEGVTPDDSYRTNAELFRIFPDGWDSTYADGDFAWAKNPWVWVVTFEVIK